VKKLLLPLLIIGLAYGVQHYEATGSSRVDGAVTPTEAVTKAADWRSGDQVRGSGRVTRVLSDDNEGSRHQRFIVEVSPGRTLLIAHNIDLAPRVQSIRAGDTVSFFGEYEWNDRGGVIHWTHHDPRGSHVGGWLEHKGRRYE